MVTAPFQAAGNVRVSHQGGIGRCRVHGMVKKYGERLSRGVIFQNERRVNVGLQRNVGSSVGAGVWVGTGVFAGVGLRVAVGSGVKDGTGVGVNVGAAQDANRIPLSRMENRVCSFF